MTGIITVRYRIISDNHARLFQKLREERIKTFDITDKDDMLFISVTIRFSQKLKKLLDQSECVYETVSKGALIRLFDLSMKRSGLCIGAVICTAAVLTAKDRTLDIKVLTDNKDISSSVMTIMKENGAGIGSYIPGINKPKIERLLKQKAEGISWAGISITDSTLTVDVIENIPQPPKHCERMPSDLVAAHDGVIEKVEILNGRLEKTIGSGVVKGEIIVSGKIPEKRTTVIKDEETGLRTVRTEESTRYVRSIGEVYGTYTDTQVFEQSYNDTRLIRSGQDRHLKSLRLLGIEIPLYIKDTDGLLLSDEKTTDFAAAGIRIPIAICDRTYEKCTFSTVIYSKEQAAEIARRTSRTYEKNFLGDSEIKKRDEQLTYTSDKAILTVKYEIYGKMTEEKQFFIKK